MRTSLEIPTHSELKSLSGPDTEAGISYFHIKTAQLQKGTYYLLLSSLVTPRIIQCSEPQGHKSSSASPTWQPSASLDLKGD